MDYQAAFLAHMLLQSRRQSPELSGDPDRDDPVGLTVVGVVVLFTFVLCVVSAFIS